MKEVAYVACTAPFDLWTDRFSLVIILLKIIKALPRVELHGDNW
jgi:hypothetical protein